MAARWLLHDLRSPAQSLTLLADLMSDPDTEVEDILRESCTHLARALDQLTRVIHPAAPAEIGPISVMEPLAFITELHRSGRTRSRLELSLQPALPAASGIERHLEHALLNLVLNATEALQSKEGGIIHLSATVEGNHIQIAVADNGPGLPPHVVERLFQSPVESHKTVQPSGVGLLVAHALVREAGGRLAYAPEAERGARFVISLPQWQRVAAPPPAP